jgi:hypothetical protein
MKKFTDKLGVVAPLWKGVAVEVGNERIVTFTARWSNRDSVKNLACASLVPYFEKRPETNFVTPLL